MTGAPHTYFSPTYADARAKFLSAASNADVEPETHVHPLKGPRGETLALDMAAFGSKDAKKVFITMSATHGGEGFLGFAWLRRVTEGNVDLNRNFLDYTRSP